MRFEVHHRQWPQVMINFYEEVEDVAALQLQKRLLALPGVEDTVFNRYSVVVMFAPHIPESPDGGRNLVYSAVEEVYGPSTGEETASTGS